MATGLGSLKQSRQTVAQYNFRRSVWVPDRASLVRDDADGIVCPFAFSILPSRHPGERRDL